MARKIVYKCGFCREDIDTENDDPKLFFFEVDGTRRKCFHSKCYIDFNISERRRKPKTIDECNKYIESCRNTKVIETVKESARNQLFDYIVDMYELSFVTKSFYTRLSNVFNGTYKGLSRPVPPEDLLDMWKQKREFLLRKAEEQRRRDKDISGIGRVWYDLSILLSKYDSYLAWKEQQKLALADIEEKKKDSIDFVQYNDVVKRTNIKKDNNSIDINSMLDEI